MLQLCRVWGGCDGAAAPGSHKAPRSKNDSGDCSILQRGSARRACITSFPRCGEGNRNKASQMMWYKVHSKLNCSSLEIHVYFYIYMHTYIKEVISYREVLPSVVRNNQQEKSICKAVMAKKKDFYICQQHCGHIYRNLKRCCATTGIAIHWQTLF